MQLQFIQKYSRNLNLDKVRSVRTDNFDNRKHAAKIFIQMTFDQVGNLPFWCSGLLYSWTFFRFITFIRICFMGIIVLLIESMFVIVHQSGRERNSPFWPFFFSITKKLLRYTRSGLGTYIFRYLRDFIFHISTQTLRSLSASLYIPSRYIRMKINAKNFTSTWPIHLNGHFTFKFEFHSSLIYL